MLNSLRKLLGFGLLGVMLMTAAIPVVFAAPQAKGKKKGKKGGRGSKGPITKGGGRGGSM